MTSWMRISRQSRGLLLLGVCLLLLSALPPQLTLAAFKDQPIDNTLTEFARGAFQRASLGAVRIPSIPNQKLVDQTGAVQLGPIGLLRNWKKLPTSLPSKLAAMGTATLGNRMYIIGGAKPLGGRSAEVWSAAIDVTSGALVEPGWQAEPSLLAVHGSDDLAQGALVAERVSPAIAAISKAGGGGYIYVIGGTTFQGVNDLSSYSVLRGDVGADGRMTGPWQELPQGQIPLPDPADPFFHPGLTQAAAVPFTLANGRTFIYLIGGLQRYLNGTTLTSAGARQTWYAEVNASNGLLYKPSSNKSIQGWELLGNIPLPPPPEVPTEGGLWNSVAVADHFVTSIGGFSDALYLIGGQTTSSTASQAVFRGLINSSTGALTWTTNEGPDLWQGTLPQARAGHGGALFRGNVYLTSGQQGGSVNPDTSVLTTYVENNLHLHNFGALGVGSDFLENPTALSVSGGGPGTPRTTHGTILVPAGPQAPNAAFIYMLGGRGDLSDGDSSDDQGSDTIVMAKIGGDEDISNTGYAPDGLYYSKVYPITFDQAEVRQISWATQITTTATPMDIAIDYRVSNDSNCSNPSWTDASWQPLDGAPADGNFRSIDGQNVVDITSVPAHCFQYRATLTSSSDLKQTPSLLNVSIRIFVPGSPDLSVKTLSDRRGAKNSFTGLNVIIQNVNQLAPPTLAADVDSPGSFYVDLCIYGPNASGGPPTLPLTPSNKQCSKAFSNVDKSALGPNAIYPVTRWFDTATEQPVELISYFQQPGTYTVYAAVDSYVDDSTQFPRGFVDEGDQGESNNVSAALTFDVQSVGRAVYLAQMRR